MSALPWHQSIVDDVHARLAAGRLPHALLICGPEGWGERQLANWLALTLLALDPQRDAAALAHPDLRWVEPEGAIIKVDAVRELVAFCQGTPQAGQRKAAVLADAHFLNQSSANALLKTLEEPPGNTHLLLFSAHPGRLLPTIRSRCQRLTIHPDPDSGRAWLASQAGVDGVDQRLFEHGGAPVAVLAASERGEEPLDDLIRGALAGRPAVEGLLKPGLSGSLARWYRYLRALLAGEWSCPALKGVAARQLLEFADELTWARRQLVTSNSVNERLLAERLIARWRSLKPG